MWEDAQRLVFSAELPLTDQTVYLRYHIWTWPITNNETDFTVEIEAPSDVALNTEAGGIFEPHSCIGHHV